MGQTPEVSKLMLENGTGILTPAQSRELLVRQVSQSNGLDALELFDLFQKNKRMFFGGKGFFMVLVDETILGHIRFDRSTGKYLDPSPQT